MNKWLIALAITAVLAMLVWHFFEPAKLVESARTRNDNIIAKNLAYHYGTAAYLYGYPIVDMVATMHNETHRVAPDQQVYAPVNRLYRFPDLVGPETAGNLRAPNNVTLYYSGWFDIANEPLIIHTPDTGGRYFTISVTNLYSEVEHIGRRTTGTDEGYFALVPPHWKGELPDGVTPIPVETSQGWLLGRMYVDGPEDFDAAMALVAEIWLASLGEFVFGQPPEDPEEQIAVPSAPLETLEFFEFMNDALRTLPAREGEAALMAQFDAIGVGPNSDFDESAIDDATRKGLKNAIKDGKKVVEASTFRTTDSANGWMISHDIGRYGYQYMHRASVVKGGYGNLPEESLYPAAIFDADGNMLSGKNDYVLHFAAGEFPPVNGFWSLAVYTMDAELVSNEIERYSIGDLTDGLEFADDGSLTLRLQHSRPDSGIANWLPTPKGSFFAVMRLYEPTEAALNNAYVLPRITKISD
ncbi:MAG: DUF1214 domain-containing protein [Gammaproteobacteria bacterium]|nr:DUF1214 domain-containing protein [Gammaproteobacteria bacterium]